MRALTVRVLFVSDLFQVAWGESLQQDNLIDMLANRNKLCVIETPFSLSRVGDDNADELVSPYRVDRTRIVENIRTMLSWLDRERGGKKAELWFTEGYDDSFTELEGSYQQLYQNVETLLLSAESLPSVRLRLTTD